MRPAILRCSSSLEQQMIRFAGPNASQPSQRISHILRCSGGSFFRILRCLRFLISTVSNTAKMSRFATPARSTPSQNWGQRSELQRQTVPGISTYTKVVRFATQGRLFASCSFEMLAQPRTTHPTFRWAKRISTISTHFPHFEMLGRHQKRSIFKLNNCVLRAIVHDRVGSPKMEVQGAPSVQICRGIKNVHCLNRKAVS